jgi:chromosome segregation ATPase
MAELSKLRDWLRGYVEVSKLDTPEFHRLMKLSEGLARDDIGKNSTAEIERKLVRLDELENANRLQQSKIIGLESQVKELQAKLAELELEAGKLREAVRTAGAHFQTERARVVELQAKLAELVPEPAAAPAQAPDDHPLAIPGFLQRVAP